MSARRYSGPSLGQQQSPQHRPERAWLDVGAKLRSKLAHDRVGLLRGDAPLFDREVGDVAGGIDVRCVVDEPVSIGAQEAVAVVLQSGDDGTAEARHRHDALGLDAPARHQLEMVVVVGGHGSGAVQLDTVALEHLAHALRCLSAEQPQRRLLRRHQGDPSVAHAALRQAFAGHQGQLVGGQRPDHAGGHHEGHLAHLSAFQLFEDLGNRPALTRPRERQGPGDGRMRPRTDGDHAIAVRELLARARVKNHVARIDALERVNDVTRTVLGGDPVEVEVRCRAEVEGLGHRQRPIDELVRPGTAGRSR